MGEIVSSSVRRWIEAFEADVRSGKASLIEVVDLALSDLEEDWETCPRCAVRPVRKGQPGTMNHGQCRVCVLRGLAAMQQERVAELEAIREHNVGKQALKRLRDELGVMPDRLKRTRDYTGRVRMVRSSDDEDYGVCGCTPPVTNLPLGTRWQTCAACGNDFILHGQADNDVCPDCTEQRERRAERRA